MADPQEQILVNAETDYEREDMRLMVIGVLALIILALLVLAPLILRGAYPQALADADRKPAVLLPAPQLQTAPADDLRALRAEEEARLNSYGWVDRAKGIVHVPIGQAMKETVAKGIPGFPKAAP